MEWGGGGGGEIRPIAPHPFLPSPKYLSFVYIQPTANRIVGEDHVSHLKKMYIHMLPQPFVMVARIEDGRKRRKNWLTAGQAVTKPRTRRSSGSFKAIRLSVCVVGISPG